MLIGVQGRSEKLILDQYLIEPEGKFTIPIDCDFIPQFKYFHEIEDGMSGLIPCNGGCHECLHENEFHEECIITPDPNCQHCRNASSLFGYWIVKRFEPNQRSYFNYVSEPKPLSMDCERLHGCDADIGCLFNESTLRIEITNNLTVPVHIKHYVKLSDDDKIEF